MYAHRAIVIDALTVLCACGLAPEGFAAPRGNLDPSREEAQAQAVGAAIATLAPETWERLTHQQRQILLVARATVAHYPHTTPIAPPSSTRRSAGIPMHSRGPIPT